MNELNESKIAFKYFSSVIFSEFLNTKNQNSSQEIQTFFHEMMNYGFIPSDDFRKNIHLMDVEKLYYTFIPIMQESIGGDVIHKPMYVNFPQSVIDMDDSEWIINAIVHYCSCGEILPQYEHKMRKSGLEPNVKYKVVDLISCDQLQAKFKQLASSDDSLTNFDKKAIQFALESKFYNFDGLDIPFAETRCMFLAHYLENFDEQNFNKTLNNMTDILRVCTYLSGGDVSLAKNTKFINFRRPLRRFLTKSLEIFWDDETAHRHKNKWVKLLHSLHVGDYSEKVWLNAQKLRENIKIETFNSLVEEHIKNKKYFNAIDLLKQRPSEFARRLDHLMREMQSIAPERVYPIVEEFKEVISKVPSKILIQVYGHFDTRELQQKLVMSKSPIGNPVVIPQKGIIEDCSIKDLLSLISSELINRFKKLPELGKVWVSPDLKNCPVPSGMRSVSDGLVTVPRGTQFNISDDNTLRFFLYWVGDRVDIDLSCVFYDEEFNDVGSVSYRCIRNDMFGCYHSGDITSAPEGASEFIDIDIKKASLNSRYVVMNVLSYSMQNFIELEKCFCGWMSRSKPNSNEIYEPKTVKHKIDLINKTKQISPAIFDLKERKVIFADMSLKTPHSMPNNVESNAAGIKDILFGALNPPKMSLHRLFTLHAYSRGVKVSNKEDADITFGLEDCNITPHNWLEIQTEWVV